MLASFLSVAAFDFFCVPPYYTFAVSDGQYMITFVVMLIIALVISSMTVRIRQQAEEAELKEQRTAALFSMSRDLSSMQDMQAIATIGLRHISTVFDCGAVLFIADDDRKLLPVGTSEADGSRGNADEGIAAWVYQNQQVAGPGTPTLPGTNDLYLPLAGTETGQSLGVLVVHPKSDKFGAPQQLQLLQTFANQMALACGRARLSEQTEQARLQAKAEQLRSSLLSSISHDLRTPLATISGAASSIIEGSENLDIASCKAMVHEIYDESIRLNRLVGNLLDMTKVESGTLAIAREAQPIDEVVGAAVGYIEDRVQSRRILTDIPDDLPLVSIDAILIHQVLINLLENAVKYTPEDTEILISATTGAPGFIIVSVLDRGPGIIDKQRIFEKFYREQAGPISGAGLGLAICAGMVEAHGGRIWVEDRPGGGAAFKFTLPIADNLPVLPIDTDDEPIKKSSDV